MWIMIMGAEGTGKEVIADILEKRNFARISQRPTGEELYPDLDYVTRRLGEQLSAQAIMHKKDVFTIRSIWDTLQVMAMTSVHMNRQSPFEAAALNIFSKNLYKNEQIVPPHCVVYCKLNQRDMQDRLLLKGRQPNDQEMTKQIELYDAFSFKIRIPIIELDMGQKPHIIRDELNFSIDSMKATSLASQSIWGREMFF